jgi:hypothetical protein
LRLKEQMDKLEMLASPFNNKPDPFFEGLMKLSPEEADVSQTFFNLLKINVKIN